MTTISTCAFDIDDCHFNGRRKAAVDDGGGFHDLGKCLNRIDKAIKRLLSTLREETTKCVSELESIVSIYFSLHYCELCLKKVKKAIYNSLWAEGVVDRLYDQRKYKGKYAINVFDENYEFISSFDNANDFACFFGISLKAARSRLSYAFPGHEGWSEKTAWLNDRKVIMQFVIDDDDDE